MKRKANWLQVFFFFLFVLMIPLLFIFWYWLLNTFYSDSWSVILSIGLTTLFFASIIFIFVGLLKLAREVGQKKRPFDFLKKREEVSLNMILLSSLEHLHLDITPLSNGMDILLNKQMIAIRFIKGEGFLKGKRYDLKWTLNNKEIDNPFQKADICYLVREKGINYLLDDIFVGDVAQIVFKIERKLANVKNK